MTRLQTHIVLSTAHLESHVSDALSEMGADRDEPSAFTDWRRLVVCCEFAVGHWVRLAHGREGMEREEALAEIPACLAACVRYADSWAASWILFDRDAEPVETIETHDW